MEEEKYDNLGGRTGMRGGLTARERMQREANKARCSRCKNPNTSKPQSLNHYKVTCSACSTIINREIDERYFDIRVDTELEPVLT